MSFLESLLTAACRLSSVLSGGAIAYSRGSTSLPFVATYGRALESADDALMRGTDRLEFSDRDFLFPAASLGSLGEPSDGDLVTIADGGREQGCVYEVMPIPGGRSFRSCDPQGIVIRVHTKLVQVA